ncbi:Elongation of very long chain fatty acids protein, partial [Fragariocoptes setiger]
MSATVYDTFRFLTLDVFDRYGDPRIAHYPLMRTPWPIVGMTCVYIWFVKFVGPAIMRDRKPYELRTVIRIYNLAMAVWNAFGFFTACQLVNYGLETFGCLPVDPNQRDPKTLSQLYYGWMFLTSRLIEFADTVFFVLRKKDRQISAFHVFHHSSVPTVVWSFMKFAPGGNAGIFPFINTFIHTIMYTYYLLATYPELQPYLGWKKYLTQLQIVQFFIIIACCLQPTLIPGCKTPRALSYIMVAFSLVFIYLFVDFYLKNYQQQQKKRLHTQQQQQQHQKELQQIEQQKLQQQHQHKQKLI